MFFYISLILFILWAIFFYKYTQYWFTEKFKYLDKIQTLEEPKYFSYIRKDKKNWNFWEFYFVGLFLLIPRIILFLSSIHIIYVFLRITNFFFKRKNFQKEQTPLYFKITQFQIKLLVRILFISFGIFSIKEKKIKFDAKKYPKLKKAGKIEESDIIISNHVCISDIMYNFTKSQRCFVMKKSLSKIPIVNFYATLYQGLIVNRGQKSSREELLLKLQKRVSEIKAGKLFNKLVIFPEGTTSNGLGLLNFKKGAFMLGANLRVIGLKYGRRRFSCENNCIGMADSFLGAFCNLYNELEVLEIDASIGKREGVEVGEFMGEVRRMMCEEFGFVDSGGSYREKVEFEKKYFKVIV